MKQENSITLRLIADRKIEPSRAVAALAFFTEIIEFEIDTAQEYCSAKINNADTRSGIEFSLSDIKFSVGLINKAIEFSTASCVRMSSMDADQRSVRRDILLELCSVQADNIQHLIATLRDVCESMVIDGRCTFYGATGLVKR